MLTKREKDTNSNNLIKNFPCLQPKTLTRNNIIETDWQPETADVDEDSQKK